MATLKIGVSRQADVQYLLGSPNEVETDKVPCPPAGSSCLKTTTTWTYFQVKNGKNNAQSSSSPVKLTFESSGVLLSIDGAWTDIPARP